MFKEYRKNKGLTLEQVAEACNISWRNLFRIENGSYKNAKFETIIKLIKVLDISDKDILKLIKDYQK
ncbi:MAG: helix-turn-helix domain-containing protein [Bacilli bacterium]